MKEKPLLKIGWKDALKGFIVAILMIVLSGITTSLDSGHLPDLAQLKTLLIIGFGSGVSYLLKNWLTNSSDEFLTKEK